MSGARARAYGTEPPVLPMDGPSILNLPDLGELFVWLHRYLGNTRIVRQRNVPDKHAFVPSVNRAISGVHETRRERHEQHHGYQRNLEYLHGIPYQAGQVCADQIAPSLACTATNEEYNYTERTVGRQPILSGAGSICHAAGTNLVSSSVTGNLIII